MPLYGQYGEIYVGQSLDCVISRAADREQSLTGAVYGLMVGGIYQRAVSVELIKEVPASQIAVVHVMKLILADPFVDVGGVDVLCDVAAEMDVNDLKPFADAKHGLFLCHKTGEKLKLQNVQFRIHVSGTVIRLAEKGGRYIAAAGEKQMSGLIRGLGMEGGMAGDAQTFQGFFVVFCIFTAACYEYGRERGHRLTPSCGEEALLYLMQKTKIGLKIFIKFIQ